ncbi:MAG: hypothetical protein R3D44_11960 [Hyphomicrobiaceae bacterium]
MSRRLLIKRALLAGASALAYPGLGTGSAGAQTVAPPAQAAIGANVGYGMDLSRASADIAAFEKLIARPIGYLVDGGAQRSWREARTSAVHALEVWRRAALGTRRKLLWNQPLTMEGTPLSQVAAGVHDDVFTAIAVNIRDAGFYDAIVNLGWDMTGSWVPWTATGGHEGDYIGAFRRVASLFKRVSPSFRICWSPARNQAGVTPDAVYPGDEHVDLLGMSVLVIGPPKGPGLEKFIENTVIGHGTAPEPEKLPFGLAWLAEFAAIHHKGIVLPEVGVAAAADQAGNATQAFDDDMIVTRLAQWINARGVLLHCWRDIPGTEAYPLHTRISRASSITRVRPALQADERPLMATAYRKAFRPSGSSAGG